MPIGNSIDEPAPWEGADSYEGNYGVVFLGSTLYQEGAYQVVVGFLANHSTRDIPHYLVVNEVTGVVEGSAARLFEARGIAAAFNAELKAQDSLIAKGVGLVELQTADAPKGGSWN